VENYRRKTDANIESLKHYFKDKEWFDKTTYTKGRQFDYWSNKATAIPPKRCPKCKRAFQMLIQNVDHRPYTYLLSALFVNVRLEKEICHECK